METQKQLEIEEGERIMREVDEAMGIKPENTKCQVFHSKNAHVRSIEDARDAACFLEKAYKKGFFNYITFDEGIESDKGTSLDLDAPKGFSTALARIISPDGANQYSVALLKAVGKEHAKDIKNNLQYIVKGGQYSARIGNISEALQETAFVQRMFSMGMFNTIKYENHQQGGFRQTFDMYECGKGYNIEQFLNKIIHDSRDPANLPSSLEVKMEAVFQGYKRIN